MNIGHSISKKKKYEKPTKNLLLNYFYYFKIVYLLEFASL